jgi:hypothetical protein
LLWSTGRWTASCWRLWYTCSTSSRAGRQVIAATAVLSHPLLTGKLVLLLPKCLKPVTCACMPAGRYYLRWLTTALATDVASMQQQNKHVHG